MARSFKRQLAVVSTLGGMTLRWLFPLSIAVVPACGHADTSVSPQRVATESTAPVLIVLSTADTQTLADGTTRKTGFFLNEFYEVKRGLDAVGVPYVLATVGGAPPALDPESVHEKYWKGHPSWRSEAIAWFEDDPEVGTPVDLAVAARDPGAYAGIVVPGGQGVMTDLLEDPSLHGLIVALGTRGAAVGLVCHAPAVLGRLPQESSPFEGRRVTSVSRLEEVYIERRVMGAEALDRRIGRQLRKAGLRHRAAFPGSAHAVRDGNLVTSQNPFSGDAFVELYVAALRESLSLP